MASCEKCWGESGGDLEKYTRLLNERKCTPEEQAGEAAGFCTKCERQTVHQHLRRCVLCWEFGKYEVV
jgi:hypothetical protein